MKKILYTTAYGAILACSLQAGGLSLDVGAGAWKQKSSGDIGYYDKNTNSSGTYLSNENTTSELYAWADFKHPLFFLPNLKVEYSELTDDGSADGTFEDFNTGGLTKTASLDIKQYDITPYYNLMDKLAWMTLDVGLTAKILDVSYRADNVNIVGVGVQNYEDSSLIAIPLVYSKFRVDIGDTGLGIEASGKYVTYDGSTVYDAEIKADYTFDFFSVANPALEIGYRAEKFDLTDNDTTTLNMKFSGFFAGAMIRF